MRRARGSSLRAIADTFGISLTRVVQLLDEAGGDPLFDRRLATMSERELSRAQARLVERIATDLRRLVVVQDELETRRIDRIAGVG